MPTIKRDFKFWQKAKNAKYRAKTSVYEGKFFASNKELQRYKQLKLLLKTGKITGLTTQVSFDLVVKGHKIGRYVADFVYYDTTSGEKIVEDVKSSFTAALPVYKLKKKLMFAIYGITIFET